MNHIRRSTFLLGFLIASLVAIIIWYYQKSTSTEDGALDLLERYAQVKTRLQQLEEQISSDEDEPDEAKKDELPVHLERTAGNQTDDLRQINGIGPGYARRLEVAGITSFSRLAASDPAELRRIVGSRPDVESWIAAARSLIAG